MKIKAIILAAVIAALLTAGIASAQVVREGGASGQTPEFSLAATDTTTAFSVGAWTFSPAPVVVKWFTDCGFPQNDRAGEVVLASGESARVFTASRAVGAPWHGWDTCSVTAFYAVDFGTNQDGSPVDSTVTGWLVSDNGR